MKTFLNKFASAAATATVLLIGCAMAGLGLTVMAFLAVFALAAFTLAFIASPIMAWAAQQGETEGNDIIPGTPNVAE